MKRFFAIVVVASSVIFLLEKGAFAASQEVPPLSGKVIETMDSGGYTYVCLEKDAKKIWVAVPQMKVVKGKNMSFEPGIEMVDFESKTLKRKFDKIYFSGGPVKQ